MLDYANTLLAILDEEATDVVPCNDAFYGLFQCFMPDAQGLDAVFKPLQDGRALQERILPIYTATAEHYKRLLEEGAVPGYFCPVQQLNNEQELIALGHQHIRYLKDLALFCDEPKLAQQLSAVTEVEVISQALKKDPKTDILDDNVFELLNDWSITQQFADPRLKLLQEAYYSIACSYYLAYYLQYPAYSNKPEHDVLRPYFELWLKGYKNCFSGGKLIIYR